MKRLPWGLYFFSAGLLLLVMQFFVILFGYVNNDYGVTTEQFAILEEVTFFDVLKDIWSGIAGILLFIFLYVRRFVKGPDTLMMLVGIMLWVIQILALRDETASIPSMFIKYIIGIVGILLVVIATLIDVYMQKNESDEDNDVKF
ncbi:MAG: hypothetical protein E7566_04680 [Ruminococcaceae bacterium]|nr:hypothetical protein [Oscillospiraceae bacterium]